MKFICLRFFFKVGLFTTDFKQSSCITLGGIHLPSYFFCFAVYLKRNRVNLFVVSHILDFADYISVVPLTTALPHVFPVNW